MAEEERREVRLVERGARSTLYADEYGSLYRFFHDTQKWDGPRPAHIDEKGVARLRCNRRLDVALREEEDGFRGASATNAAPPHLHAALAHLVRRTPRDVREFARQCGVQVSTAWSYACRVVEAWPQAHEVARPLVYPPVLDAMQRLPDRSGSLTDVMPRLGLEGDSDWRCAEDRYAHARLARLCVEAAILLGDAT